MIRLKRIEVCEEAVPKPTGGAKAVRPHTAINLGDLDTAVVVFTFRGSAGRYDVRLTCERPDGKLTGGAPSWVALDGEHEYALSVRLDCSKAGTYRFDAVVLDPSHGPGTTHLGTLTFEVRAQ